jgi:hypothetical protein
MPKIFFCGDPHGCFDHVIDAVQQHRPSAVVFLGDLTPPQPLEVVLLPILDLTEVWFIHGNHDTDNEASYDNLFSSVLADRNLHGRVVEVAGVRIAGLGGVFRAQVWAPPEEPGYPTAQAYLAQCGKGNHWRGGLPLKHRSSIFPADVECLGKLRADVLITHEAPSYHRSHPHGFQIIDDLAVGLGVKRLFHGHHHRTHGYDAAQAHGLEFRAMGVGNCSIVDQDGKVIVNRPGFCRHLVA